MRPLKLNALRFARAQAPSILILHGLLGSSKNWLTIARHLQSQFDLHLLDLRNHGGSPHASSMRWSDLVADVLRYLNDENLADVHLIGHSLGGKLAMKLACEQSKRIKKLVIVDIAAKQYAPHFDAVFRAMKRLHLSELSQRREAELILGEWIPDWALRQFILTNLVCDEAGFKWQVNLEALHASLPIIRQNVLSDSDQYTGPACLIRGLDSDFVDKEDIQKMRRYFPTLHCEAIENAGHNVHVENRAAFLHRLIAWL